MVTPRGPTPADLREVDLLRASVRGVNTEQVVGYVVHSTPDQDPDNRALVEWVSSGRPLSTRGIDDLPVLWGL